MMKYVAAGIKFGISAGVAAFVATVIYCALVATLSSIFGKKGDKKKHETANNRNSVYGSYDDDLK